MTCTCRNDHSEPADCADLDAEIRRLQGAPLGFPYNMAVYLAQRAHARDWLPVRDPALPAGPDNLAHAPEPRPIGGRA